MALKEYRLTGGGICSVEHTAMSFSFNKPRTCMSTGLPFGGIGRFDGVFNQRLPKGIKTEKDLPGGSIENYMASVCEKLGFSAGSGLLTSARMECLGHAIVFADGITVEVFATGGVEGNSARAGEAPQYRETANGFQPVGGTINLFVFLSFALPPGALARTFITVTEAKSALLAELGVFSIYGENTATGTGTDGAVIIMADGGPVYRDVGTHSEIGYLLAQGVKQAVGQTLANECYWTRGAQLMPKRLLLRLAKTRKQYNGYLPKFAALSFERQEQLIEGLSLWHTAKEQLAWGGISLSAFAWLEDGLRNKYPVLHDWL